MSDVKDIPLLDHDLAADEFGWMSRVYADFAAARAAFDGPASAFDPKEALRSVLSRSEYKLDGGMELAGPGPWRLGQNAHGRNVAAVFLPRVELHRHPKSRTDQFAMYVVGEADAFSVDTNGKPLLTPVSGGQHFHNPPGAPHAFLPKVGQPTPADWQIAFIAITPRNLREDTYAVSDDVKAAYKSVVGTEAPHGV